MNSLQDPFALVLFCIDKRVALELACAIQNRDEIEFALWGIGGLAQTLPERDFPILKDPILAPVVRAGRNLGRLEERLRIQKRSLAERARNLPSAEQLMDQVSKHRAMASGPFEFATYQLWPEGHGWSLTNAYGIDRCMHLSSVHHFEKLLVMLRLGIDVGPVPPVSQDPSFEEQYEGAERSFDRACAVVADQILERLLA